MLEVITSPMLRSRHGFFTRRGGHSSGVLKGLNCGFGARDDPKTVEKNRDLIKAHLGAESLSTLYQVHSSDVAPAGSAAHADAQVTRKEGLALGVLTADCAPVLFEDFEARVIGSAHSGWRGALGGVLENTIAAMEGAGARRAAIKAVVGPAISQANYEVGSEFREAFLKKREAFDQYFIDGDGPGKYHFDLPGFCVDRLIEAGVTAEHTGHCTYQDPLRFYSYRRATHQKEEDYGRLLAAIRL